MISIGLDSPENKQIWSLPLRLGMRTSNFQDATILEECVKVGSSIQISIFDDCRGICHQFAFKFVKRDGIYVATIRERFTMHNLSSHVFQMTSLMFKNLQPSQVNFYSLILHYSSDLLKNKNIIKTILPIVSIFINLGIYKFI